jgi:3-dehydroquinate dehydratase II
MMNMDVLLLNGPNQNLYGKRNPTVYGHTTLATIEQSVRDQAKEMGWVLECYQSNSEGALIDRIHLAEQEGCKYIITNMGAYTHTSIGIRDAFEGVDIPFVEIHISNVFARQDYRRTSYIAEIATAVLAGCGAYVYNLAMTYVDHELKVGHI